MTRDQDGEDVVTIPIADIAYPWNHRLKANTFELGLKDNIARQRGGIRRCVSVELQ